MARARSPARITSSRRSSSTIRPNNFAALDRFGRVLDQVWSSYGSASGNAGTLDGYTYTYDRAGNRTSRDEPDRRLRSSETYGYDNLGRLTSMSRGVLSGGTIPARRHQTWTLDSLGNFTNFTDNRQLQTQTRTVDPANEIQTISGSSGHAGLRPGRQHDHDAGPEPVASTALNCVYDAWNRLVQVSSGGTGFWPNISMTEPAAGSWSSRISRSSTAPAIRKR